MILFKFGEGWLFYRKVISCWNRVVGLRRINPFVMFDLWEVWDVWLVSFRVMIVGTSWVHFRDLNVFFKLFKRNLCEKNN